MKTSGFIVLTGWAIELLELYGVDDSVSLTIFCHVHALTSNEGTRGGYDGTLNTLAFWTLSKTKNRVMRSLEKLVEVGLLLKETESQNNILRCRYRSNLELVEAFLRTDGNRIQNEYTISKMNTGISKIDTPRIQNEDGGISKMNTPVSKIDTHKKKDKKKEPKLKEEKERERETHAHACELEEKALEPKEKPATQYGFEIPTLEEVERTLRNITVRPPEDQIELCAGYFIDRMEREEWKTRDWRNALRRYAQRWIVRGNTGNYPKRETKQQQAAAAPAEWTPDEEPTSFLVVPIELGGSIEQNEENLRRYLEAEVIPWEKKHGKKVSWRQAPDWRQKLFAPLYKRLEKEKERNSTK